MGNPSLVKQHGATVVEYVLMVAFIAMAVIVTVALLGQRLDERYEDIVACVQDETAQACE